MSFARAVVPALLVTVVAAQSAVHPPLVTAEIHAAVQRGLAWLSRTQAADGSWRNAGDYGSYPTAMTALAGTALLASGATPTRGRHWREVRQAVAFLLAHADPGSGLIAVRGADPHVMHGHGFAVMFLASVHGMEQDLRTQATLRRVLEKGVALVASAQSAAGGWTYMPDIDDDEGSVTVTQVQALRACRMAGIVVDRRTIDRAVAYIVRCQNGDGGIRYSLRSGGPSRPAITAAGVAVFYNAGVYDEEPFVARAFAHCERQLRAGTEVAGHSFYAHLYWSQALWQRGGAAWSEYYTAQARWLLERQRADGSWEGDHVGPVYGTALALVMLQLPWALVPIFQR